MSSMYLAVLSDMVEADPHGCATGFVSHEVGVHLAQGSCRLLQNLAEALLGHLYYAHLLALPRDKHSRNRLCRMCDCQYRTASALRLLKRIDLRHQNGRAFDPWWSTAWLELFWLSIHSFALLFGALLAHSITVRQIALSMPIAGCALSPTSAISHAAPLRYSRCSSDHRQTSCLHT